MINQRSVDFKQRQSSCSKLIFSGKIETLTQLALLQECPSIIKFLRKLTFETNTFCIHRNCQSLALIQVYAAKRVGLCRGPKTLQLSSFCILVIKIVSELTIVFFSVCITEKGYLTLNISVQMKPQHSSFPPDEISTVVISRALSKYVHLLSSTNNSDI